VTSRAMGGNSPEDERRFAAPKRGRDQSRHYQKSRPALDQGPGDGADGGVDCAICIRYGFNTSFSAAGIPSCARWSRGEKVGEDLKPSRKGQISSCAFQEQVSKQDRSCGSTMARFEEGSAKRSSCRLQAPGGSGGRRNRSAAGPSRRRGMRAQAPRDDEARIAELKIQDRQGVLREACR